MLCDHQQGGQGQLGAGLSRGNTEDGAIEKRKWAAIFG